MRWTGDPDAPVTARIAALEPSLQRSERRVVATVAENLAAAVECTAQELAARAGVGRASVIRTAQTLGYDGYPQTRVALARELALAPSHEASPDTASGRLQSSVEQFGGTVARRTPAVTEDLVEVVVAAVAAARRVVVVATGLSAPQAWSWRCVSAQRVGRRSTFRTRSRSRAPPAAWNRDRYASCSPGPGRPPPVWTLRPPPGSPGRRCW